MLFNNIDPVETLFVIPVLLFSISVHEFSHSITAYTLGDKTQKHMGRITLNPLRHIDWMGFFCLAVLGYGWAKPVMVNPVQFAKGDLSKGETKGMKSGMALTSIMGPLSNFILAFFSFMVLYPAYKALTGAAPELTYLVDAFHTFYDRGLSLSARIILPLLTLCVLYNLVLGIFNLIPIPPLDGSKIFAAFLPDRLYFKFTKGGGISVIILIALIFTGAVDYILTPVFVLFYEFLYIAAQIIYFFI